MACQGCIGKFTPCFIFARNWSCPSVSPRKEKVALDAEIIVISFPKTLEVGVGVMSEA